MYVVDNQIATSPFEIVTGTVNAVIYLQGTINNNENFIEDFNTKFREMLNEHLGLVIIRAKLVTRSNLAYWGVWFAQEIVFFGQFPFIVNSPLASNYIKMFSKYPFT